MERSAGLPPLLGSFERHLRAENRADTTVTTYLIAARQAETFLRTRGKELPAASRADLEAFMGDLLARRSPSTAATYHKVLRLLYAWLELVCRPSLDLRTGTAGWCRQRHGNLRTDGPQAVFAAAFEQGGRPAEAL